MALRIDRDAAAAATVQLTLMPQSETYPRTGTLLLRASGVDVATFNFARIPPTSGVMMPAPDTFSTALIKRAAACGSGSSNHGEISREGGMI